MYYEVLMDTRGSFQLLSHQVWKYKKVWVFMRRFSDKHDSLYRWGAVWSCCSNSRQWIIIGCRWCLLFSCDFDTSRERVRNNWCPTFEPKYNLQSKEPFWNVDVLNWFLAAQLSLLRYRKFHTIKSMRTPAIKIMERYRKHLSWWCEVLRKASLV